MKKRQLEKYSSVLEQKHGLQEQVYFGDKICVGVKGGTLRANLGWCSDESMSGSQLSSPLCVVFEVCSDSQRDFVL